MQAAVILSIDEAAELENSNYEAIKKRIQRNSLHAVKIDTASRRGYEYRIELDELSEKARRKYFSQQVKIEMPESSLKDEVSEQEMTLEDLTEKQRAEVDEWMRIITAWRDFLSNKKKKQTIMTEAFVASWNEVNQKQISSRTLKRKYKLYQDNGPIGLADLRGQSKRKDTTVIDEVTWAIFCQWWLDEAKPAVTTVYRNLELLCKMSMPEKLPLPDVQAFYRQAAKIEYPVVQYFREGNKAFSDTCLPYLRRAYDDIDSNDIWSSDYHTLDIFVKDDITGQVFRPHAAVWIDIRSRKILSVVLMDSTTSDGIVLSFRKACEKYGLPRKVYLDNGKEYLTHAFGGRAKRKTSATADYGTNILDRCGVTMYNATVKNAKTKIIERIFRDVKYDFSRLVNTYTGGRPDERPERMKKQTKDIKDAPLFSEIREKFDLWCEGVFNEHSSKGMGMNGKCPNEVYMENLIATRIATQDQLNLMLLKSSRLQTITRNGVKLQFGEMVLDYYNEEMVAAYQNTKCYVRYDIEHLDEVRIYDKQEVFIGTAQLSMQGGYGLGTDANIDAIKRLNHKKKEKKRAVTEFMDEKTKKIQAPEMLDVVIEAAKQAIDQSTREYEAKIYEPAEFKQTVAATGTFNEEQPVTVDLGKMVKNAAKRKKK